jgi:hypothetical protein
VPQIGEFANVVREISKLDGTGFIWLFRVGVFTSFKCGLVHYHERVKRYSIDIRPPKWKKTICLGTYKTTHEASRGFNASIFYIGKKLYFNF